VPAAPMYAVETITLKCEGFYPTYPNGFGGALPESQPNSTRIVEIDLTSNSVSMNTFFGQKTASLRSIQNDSFYSFVLKHNVKFRETIIVEEQVSINRYTGEINALYILDPQPTDSMGYSAFSGICKRATKLF
jgi:hypothetical protein